MIQTKECPNCETEHRMHVKRCGCGYVFEFKTESAEPTFSKEEINRRYEARVRQRMAEFRGTPAKEFHAAKPGKLWAYRILEKVENGVSVPLIAIDFAKQVIGDTSNA